MVRASGFGFRVSGFGFQISGFRFRVSAHARPQEHVDHVDQGRVENESGVTFEDQGSGYGDWGFELRG